MLRAHLSDTKHCDVHPHRVVKTTCARCKTPYCDECLITRADGIFGRIVAKDEREPLPLFCDRCVGEVGVLQAMELERKRPLHQRLRPTRERLRRAAIWIAVIAAITLPMFVAVRSMSETTITPEELARIKLGLSGGYLAPEGVNLLGEAFGGRFVRATAPSETGHEPTRLIDTWAQAEIPAWRSANATLPIDLVFQLQHRTRFNTLVLKSHPSEPPETAIKEFELHVSENAESGFVKVASGFINAASAETRLPVAEATTRNVLLRILSAQGPGTYVSLAEIEVLLSPSGMR
ncbi:MAG: hypothetical protein ACR2NO_12835 [Chloroflexota bacterium]